jgi:hypothetical protein
MFLSAIIVLAYKANKYSAKYDNLVNGYKESKLKGKVDKKIKKYIPGLRIGESIQSK